MKQLVQSIWGSTVKLALTISLLAVLVGIVLVNVVELPQTAVVIGVMVVGFVTSFAASGRPQPEPARVPVRHHGRSAA